MNGRWRILLVLPLISSWPLLLDRLPRAGLAPRPRRFQTRSRWEWVVAAIGLNLVSVRPARRLLGDHDQALDPAAAPERSGSCSRRSPSACSRTRSCRGVSASPAEVACCARSPRAPRMNDGDARRIGVRPPHVRPVPGGSCWCTWVPLLRQDPGLGADLDRGGAPQQRSPSSCSPSGRHAADGTARAGRVGRSARSRTGRHRLRSCAGPCRRDRGAFQSLAGLPALRGLDDDARVQHPPAVLRRGVVLVLMNVATIFPLWPGNVGLQAAIACRSSYGVPYGKGFTSPSACSRSRPRSASGSAYLPRAGRPVVRDAAGRCRRRPREAPLEPEQERVRAGVSG